MAAVVEHVSTIFVAVAAFSRVEPAMDLRPDRGRDREGRPNVWSSVRGSQVRR